MFPILKFEKKNYSGIFVISILIHINQQDESPLSIFIFEFFKVHKAKSVAVYHESPLPIFIFGFKSSQTTYHKLPLSCVPFEFTIHRLQQ